MPHRLLVLLGCLLALAAAAAAPAPRLLGLTAKLADGVLEPGRWENGWRDEGTSDTRPRLKAVRQARDGEDAIALEVWYPNSAEFVDYLLPAGERGSDWAAAGAGYLSFWYRTDDLRGNMQVRLSRSIVRWGLRGATAAAADFSVEPGPWRRIVLPLNAFLTRNEGDRPDEALASPDGISVLSLGYGNHRLQSPGTIQFTHFEVGLLPTLQPSRQPLPLTGAWKFRLDNVRPDGSRSVFGGPGEHQKHQRDCDGYGRELGYAKPDYDDSAWKEIAVPASWEAQGYGYDGPAWYRRQVTIPEAWQGQPLRLRLGRPDDRGTVYWNGEAVATVKSFGPSFDVVLKPEQILAGRPNSIAVQVFDWYREGGLNSGSFDLGPVTAEPRGRITLAWAGDPASVRPAAEFEMGAKPGRLPILSFSLPRDAELSPDGLHAELSLQDCFHREVFYGSLPLTTGAAAVTASLALDAAQARRLFYGEWFRAQLLVCDAAGEPRDAAVWHEVKLKYEARDALALPALPEQFEDTPYGRLKLIDTIDCGADPDADPHPYKEGGIRKSWVGTRAYATWQQGVAVASFQGRKYREANNNEFFGYRIGRGELKPHAAYVLRLLVPEDKPRYAPLNIQAGRNYQGTGYMNGTGPADPCGNYPLAQTYQWYDHLVYTDDLTYGYLGARKAATGNGFWVFFHDTGRCYAGAWPAGPAVAEMRLYKVSDLAAAEPVIRYPEGQPRRLLMMDWERQPEAPPLDVARWARLAGLNAVAPVFQKWSFAGFWRSELGFAPANFYRVAPEGEDDRDVYAKWLAATRETGMGLMPRIEYGGGPKLPKEAWVIGADGKTDRCGRYTQWGANILHEQTWTEFKALLDELLGQSLKDNPQLAGVLWRQRQERIACSYGPADVARFCQDTGQAAPSGPPEAVAKWASQTVGPEYHAWWQRQRADFLRRTRDLLQSYRPGLRLVYYNWDEDGWNLGFNRNAVNTAADWSDFYNVDRAGLYARRMQERLAKIAPADFVRMLTTFPRQNRHIYPELFRGEDSRGIAILAPVNHRYLADNEAFINYFQTADGVAVCKMFDYEEKGRWNVQGDNYETSELTPGGHDFGMAEEVLACFHGDPGLITWTPYTYGRGWLDVHRRFAQAFLALPDTRGSVHLDVVQPVNPDVRVRTYAAGARTYVGVVHRGAQPASFRVSLSLAGGTVTDLVTGQSVPCETAGGRLSFTVASGPMQLHSYRVE